MINSRTSGLIQRVTPSRTSGLIEIDDYGSSAQGVSMWQAAKDPNSPKSIPDTPSTEFPFDGLHGFGIINLEVAGP